jgi:hypothetical protein
MATLLGCFVLCAALLAYSKIRFNDLEKYMRAYEKTINNGFASVAAEARTNGRTCAKLLADSDHAKQQLSALRGYCDARFAVKRRSRKSAEKTS